MCLHNWDWKQTHRASEREFAACAVSSVADGHEAARRWSTVEDETRTRLSGVKMTASGLGFDAVPTSGLGALKAADEAERPLAV